MTHPETCDCLACRAAYWRAVAAEYQALADHARNVAEQCEDEKERKEQPCQPRST